MICTCRSMLSSSLAQALERPASVWLLMLPHAQLMKNKGITPMFTLIELRDNITEHDCEHRGQSRKFNLIDWNLKFSGAKVSLKVLVIHLHIFKRRSNALSSVQSQAPPPQCQLWLALALPPFLLLTARLILKVALLALPFFPPLPLPLKMDTQCSKLFQSPPHPWTIPSPPPCSPLLLPLQE